jgi:hypothetical protein
MTKGSEKFRQDRWVALVQLHRSTPMSYQHCREFLTVLLLGVNTNCVCEVDER